MVDVIYQEIVKKPLTWYNNPKFHLCFEIKKNKEEKKENKKDNKDNKDKEEKIEEQKEENKNNEEENNLNNNDEENKENTINTENFIPRVDFEVVFQEELLIQCLGFMFLNMIQ